MCFFRVEISEQFGWCPLSNCRWRIFRTRCTEPERSNPNPITSTYMFRIRMRVRYSVWFSVEVKNSISVGNWHRIKCHWSISLKTEFLEPEQHVSQWPMGRKENPNTFTFMQQANINIYTRCILRCYPMLPWLLDWCGCWYCLVVVMYLSYVWPHMCSDPLQWIPGRMDPIHFLRCSTTSS